MYLDGCDVKPHDTLVYQPTEGSEVRGEVRHVQEREGLDVVVEGRSIGLSLEALCEADAEGRLRVAPARGRGRGEPMTRSTYSHEQVLDGAVGVWATEDAVAVWHGGQTLNVYLAVDGGWQAGETKQWMEQPEREAVAERAQEVLR